MKLRNIARRILEGAACTALIACAPLGGSTSGAYLKDIQLEKLDGSTTSLSALRETYVLAHFWATWCASCREEMDSLGRIAREIDGVTVAAIAVEDEPAAVKTFVKERRFPFPVFLDQGEARSAFSIPSLPFTVLLDRSGTPAPLIDPESGESVDAITASRYWASSAALERIRRSVQP